MAGYSQRPLIDKLGIKPDARAGYDELLAGLDGRAQIMTRLVGLFDFIQYFATSTEQLEAVLPNLKRHLQSDGMLWISWAKQTSSLHTGLNEAIVRNLALKAGLVDVKVATVTDDWSGLKFVYRLTDRPKP